MTLTVFSPPEPLVSLAEVKVGLGEDGNDRDGLIADLVLAAQGEMDGPFGWTGRCVAVQGIEYVADDFSDEIVLAAGPFVSAEISYLDVDGVERILAAETYQVMADGRVLLKSGSVWPVVYSQAGAVRVRYYAGIENPADPRVSLMKTAIILHVRMTLDGHEPAASRRAIESLVRPLWAATC